MGGVLDVLGVVFKPIADYFVRRQEIKAVEHQVQLDTIKAQGERQAEAFRTGLAADAAWEMTFAQQAGNSWKDEFELIVLSAPLVMCFIPGLDVYVKKGFEAISSTPIWFQSIVVTIYLANYGIRNYRRTISDT